MNKKKAKKKVIRQKKEPAWNAEKILLWLESYRELQFEVWNKNPALRLKWQKIQST